MRDNKFFTISCFSAAFVEAEREYEAELNICRLSHINVLSLALFFPYDEYRKTATLLF
jgi:hypothetical protein